jgi:CHASE2 domain-containing sensor protein
LQVGRSTKKVDLPVPEIESGVASRAKVGRAIGSSLLATSFILALRFFSLLEGMELWTFDRMLQFRFPEPVDSRIVLLELTTSDFPEEDITKLPASTLIQILNKLKPLNPGIIGLDFNHRYLRFSNQQEDLQLTSALKNNSTVVSICEQPNITAKDVKISPSGTQPYPVEQISRDRIGFSNFPDTNTEIIRRQPLVTVLRSEELPWLNPSKDCTVTESFSLLISRRWLESQKKIVYQPPDLNNLDSSIKLGERTLNRVYPYTGGYWNRDIQDYQILLNYRPGDLSKKIKLKHFLDNPMAYKGMIQKNIVLVGLTDEDKLSDHSSTPYGKLPGVEIHVHMISQLLSATLDGRSLLWSLPEGTEILCIWIGSLGGNLLAFCSKKSRRFFQLTGFWVLGYGVSCYLILVIWGLWLPLLPVSLGFLLAAGWERYQKTFQFQIKAGVQRS